jgi:Coenzyme PQQ synthesis protein D (PqqD)
MTAPHANVTLETVLIRSDQVLFQEVGGEAVLLDLVSEQYFGLNPVGTRVWELLDDTTPLSGVHRTLCAEFDMRKDQIGQDLLALARSLLDAGLVETR